MADLRLFFPLPPIILIYMGAFRNSPLSFPYGYLVQSSIQIAAVSTFHQAVPEMSLQDLADFYLCSATYAISFRLGIFCLPSWRLSSPFHGDCLEARTENASFLFRIKTLISYIEQRFEKHRISDLFSQILVFVIVLSSVIFEKKSAIFFCACTVLKVWMIEKLGMHVSDLSV